MWIAISLTSTFIGLAISCFFICVMLFERDVVYPKPKVWPRISVIIPFWNEGSEHGGRLRKTVDSVLAADYPKDKVEIILVNDGSTDNSLEIARSYEGVTVLSKDVSEGKTVAVNFGLKKATGEYVVALDADSFIMPDVLKKTVTPFHNPDVMMVVPSIKIWKPKGILQHVQFAELFSAVFVRNVQSKLGSIPLAPGAFALIRRSFIDKHGLLSHKTMVEDLEISLRVHSEGYLIENVAKANVYTSGVTTYRAFLNQRIRWFCGFFIQMKKYRHLISPKYGNLGLFTIPVSILYVALTILLFVFSVIMLVVNTIKYIQELQLAGFTFLKLSDLHFDLFFYSLHMHIYLPLILLIVSLTFILYTKQKTEEKQNVVKPFILFTLTYWLLGSICWIIALYYYITKKPIKWGPNYFKS